MLFEEQILDRATARVVDRDFVYVTGWQVKVLLSEVEKHFEDLPENYTIANNPRQHVFSIKTVGTCLIFMLPARIKRLPVVLGVTC